MTRTPRYNTGKPCQNGHLAERYSSNGECVECARRRAEMFRGVRQRTEKVAKPSEDRDVRFVHTWTPKEDEIALALHAGKIDWVEADRQSDVGHWRLRERARHLLRNKAPSMAERKQAAALPFHREE